jgi:hypothetical protein
MFIYQKINTITEIRFELVFTLPMSESMYGEFSSLVDLETGAVSAHRHNDKTETVIS